MCLKHSLYLCRYACNVSSAVCVLKHLLYLCLYACGCTFFSKSRQHHKHGDINEQTDVLNNPLACFSLSLRYNTLSLMSKSRPSYDINSSLNAWEQGRNMQCFGMNTRVGEVWVYSVSIVRTNVKVKEVKKTCSTAYLSFSEW